MAGSADEIIVRLTADASGLAPTLEAAAADVKAVQDSIAASGSAGAEAIAGSAGVAGDAWAAMAANITASAEVAKASIADMAAAGVAPLDLLIATTGATATSLDELAAQDAQLQAAFSAGTITAEQYGEAMDALDAQTAPLIAGMEAAAAATAELSAAQMEAAAPWIASTAAVDANTGALEANAAASSGSGGGRAFGIFGALSRAMHFVATPVGAATAALAVLGADAAQQSGRVSGLTDSVLAMGNSLGVTSGQMDAWASQIGGSIATVGDAQGVFQQLALSGEFTGHELKQAGESAVIFSQLTDQSMSSAATAVERMGKSPVSAFKYLTAAQQEEVQSLLDVGDKAGAASTTIADFAQQMHKAAQEAAGDIGIFTRMGDAIAEAWDKAGRAVDVAMGGGTNEMRLASLEAARKQILSSSTSANQGGYSELPHLDKEISDLEALIAKRQAAAKEQQLSHDWINPVMGYGAKGLAVDTQAMHAHEADAHMGYQQRIDYERAFWSHMYATASKGSVEYIAAYQHMTEAAHKALTLHAYSPGGDSGWNVGALSPVDTAMIGVEARQIAHRKHTEDVQRSVELTGMQSSSAHQTAMLGMQSKHVQDMVGMGTMGAGSGIAQQQKIADEIYAIKLAELEKEKALEATKPEAVARINSQIVRLQDTHTAEMMTLSDKASAQQIKTAESVVSPIISTFSQVTAGYVEGTLTRQQAELRLGDALVAESINRGVQMLVHHIAVEEAKTIATATGTAERLALHVWAETEAAAMHALKAIEWIVTEAAKAAASAFTALAGIPIIGPVLAVGAAIAASAEVLSFVGSVSSAEGGWDRVPMGGAMTQLHTDEMVLPKHVADPVREMAGGGGGGNQYHYHIHANDSAGFESMLRRNPGALVRALGHAHATGHTA